MLFRAGSIDAFGQTVTFPPHSRTLTPAEEFSSLYRLSDCTERSVLPCLPDQSLKMAEEKCGTILQPDARLLKRSR